MFADTHCHLYLKSLHHNLNDVLKRARSQGVQRILVPGIDLPTSRVAVEMADRHAEIYAAVGVHPNDSTTWDRDSLAALRVLARHPKVVAIGEIGLDHYREHAPHDLQLSVFRQQLELAADLGLPVAIHNRAASAALWPELERWQAELARAGAALALRPGVLHSFDGTLEDARWAMERRFLLGISGPVTFKNAQERQQVTGAVPLSALITETDAPYLAPHPHRGQMNEPAWVILVTEKIAELHQLPLTAVAEQTYWNAARLFGWDRID